MHKEVKLLIAVKEYGEEKLFTEGDEHHGRQETRYEEAPTDFLNDAGHCTQTEELGAFSPAVGTYFDQATTSFLLNVVTAELSTALGTFLIALPVGRRIATSRQLSGPAHRYSPAVLSTSQIQSQLHTVYHRNYSGSRVLGNQFGIIGE